MNRIERAANAHVTGTIGPPDDSQLFNLKTRYLAVSRARSAPQRRFGGRATTREERQKGDVDPPTTGFLKVLDPNDRTAGGGTASAIAGAMAAALVAMVASLAVAPDAPMPLEFYERVRDEARDLSKRLLQGGEEDSIAFTAILAARRRPRGSDSERRERTAAIEKATVTAAKVPLENAEHCVRVLELVTELRGRSNPRAASDLECAAYLALAGLRGCIANVQVNVPSIRDAAVVAELNGRMARLPLPT